VGIVACFGGYSSSEMLIISRDWSDISIGVYVSTGGGLSSSTVGVVVPLPGSGLTREMLISSDVVGENIGVSVLSAGCCVVCGLCSLVSSVTVTWCEWLLAPCTKIRESAALGVGTRCTLLDLIEHA
jgi:hypothetical protein